MRVVDDLIAEDLVAYDGFNEALRGRPPARLKFRGAAHAIVGIEAMRGEFYGAVSDLNGHIQTELRGPADEDGERNVERLVAFIDELLAAPRPTGQAVRGIGIGVPSIVRQPDGEVVLTLGLGWRDVPLGQMLAQRFDIPLFVENDRNLAAMGEWGFGKGQGASSLVSLAIGPGAGAGIVIDGKLHRGRSHAAGELSWFLDDPRLGGRTFKLLGDMQSLRFGPYIPEQVIGDLETANRRYLMGEVGLDDVGTDPSLGAVGEILDYSTMAVATIAALVNPETVILSGYIAHGADLVLDALKERLRGNVYDAPRLVLSDLGHRDVVMGAIMLVLDATTLNPLESVTRPRPARV